MKDIFGNDYEDTGEFRPPKKGEYYFSPLYGEVQCAAFDWPDTERMIVRRLPG